jgi:hypothetical protein
MRGCLGRGEESNEESVDADLSDDNDETLPEPSEPESLTATLESESVEASVERVDTEASRSECARVYLIVVISSSSGVRKDTRFSAGNMGRDAAILRDIIECTGLLASIETRLCGCLYGIEMVADSCDSCEVDVTAEDSVDAELGVGVVAAGVVVEGDAEVLVAFGMLLSIERRGFEGRSRAG